MKFLDYLDQLTAIILILGALALLFAGIDSEVKSILIIAAGWLFGSAYQRRRKPKYHNERGNYEHTQSHSNPGRPADKFTSTPTR